MAQEARLNLRMQRELKLLLSDPPPSASFPSLSSSSSLSSISAEIEGPEGTVYAKGVFKLKIQIPERYPFQPPIVTFVTPIYHPNIDNGGRICLDILNLPPKGAWQPSLNISTVLTSIGLLLSEPNPDDGLMHDASTEYKYNRQAFDLKAGSMTQKYARGGASDYGGQDQEIQALTNAREWPVEPRESNMANSEVPDLLIKQKRLCGLSRKLSLDSAGHGGINSGETMKEVPLSRVFCEQKEVRGAEQVTKEMPSELILNQNKVQWSRKKLSLESVGPSKVRNSEKRDYTAQTQCSTHVEPQSILQNYAGIEPLPQTGRNSNNNDMRDVGVNETTEKLLLKSTGSNLKNEDIEKLQMKPQLSAQFQSTASCQTLISSDTCGGHKICHKNVVNQTGSSFSARHKKLGLTGRTHSLGTLKKDNKANYAPPQNLPISDSVSTSFLTSEIGDVSTRKSLNAHGTSVKQPLQALDQFGEGKNSSNQLISQSGKHSVVQVNHPLSCEDLRDNKQNKQPNNDDHGNYYRKIDQQEKGSPECEAVIVLDSEDSEDETSLHKRSKLLLARRPMLGKRKA